MHGVPVCSTVSQYLLLSEDGPPDYTMVYQGEVFNITRAVSSNMREEDSVMRKVGCTEICGVSLTKNHQKKRPVAANVLLVQRAKILAGYKGLHRVSLSTRRRVLQGSHLSHDLPNPTHRTLNSIVERLCLSPRWPWIDSTTNSCSFCWATNGDVLSGSKLNGLRLWIWVVVRFPLTRSSMV